MNDALTVTSGILLIIWSLFLMYFISFKLKMHEFETAMRSLLEEIISMETKKAMNRSSLHIEDALAKKLETYLIESKVVDRVVQFRFVNKE